MSQLSTECYPISTLPHPTRLYLEYLALESAPPASPLHAWYGAPPTGHRWLSTPPPGPVQADALADALEAQSRTFDASPQALANIALLRAGARAIVTGQQVGLFGGPLLTLLKAATAVARAAEATRATGAPHVPVFWLATEDHDLPEIDHAAFALKSTIEILRAPFSDVSTEPVGQVILPREILPVLDRLAELLDHAPEANLLRNLYAPGETLGRAFARLIAHLFAAHGLVVLDASTPAFHALGASTLRAAIEQAEPLEQALLDRTRDLQAAGLHAQVKVAPDMSLLFLISDTSDTPAPNPASSPSLPDRQALRRTPDGHWRAGRHTYTTADLLHILETQPERLSPNALLRPVFEDTILPTAAYIGGPSEIAYFAQSAVLYTAILGRVTPVLPRLSATLVEPAIATVMARHELTLPDTLTTPEALALRLAARAMPIEGKRKLSSAGNQLGSELEALTTYLASVDPSLGRSATVSANKMRYQMNRLRGMAARFELEKKTSLRRHAETLTAQLFPRGHPQERFLAGIGFVARNGLALIDRLVAEAANQCPGHVVIRS